MDASHKLLRFEFSAMASDCEVLTRCDARLAPVLGQLVQRECSRIEQRFSRYRDDSDLMALNRAAGQWHDIDEEMAKLLSFAGQAWHISDGLFDVSSGVLRRHWRFSGGQRVLSLPDPAELEDALAHVGWSRVELQTDRLRMPAGYELDLGGVAKEYAADRSAMLCLQLLKRGGGGACLINLGGDIVATQTDEVAVSWQIGIEAGGGEQTRGGAPELTLSKGAVATSGVTRQFLEHDGVRYGHLLDPRSGWPVADPPLTVTVQAETCMQAGYLASLACLSGVNAERMLDGICNPYWVYRARLG